MKVGILGTGVVGHALGTGFVRHGHDVMMGARDAANEKASAWVAATSVRASAGSFTDAARFGEIVVLATLWEGTEHALHLAGPEVLAGKVVIDATNPLDFSQGPPPRLAVGHTDSGGERVQRWLPEARVVKAFNTVGHAHMVDPSLPGGPPTMFIAGDDDDAKRVVTGILTEFGWDTLDLGGIEVSRYLEPMCIAWVLAGFRTGSWNQAFKMLRE